MWDPVQYAAFRDHRSRPFGDLLARVGVRDPAVVVDLVAGGRRESGHLAKSTGRQVS